MDELCVQPGSVQLSDTVVLDACKVLVYKVFTCHCAACLSFELAAQHSFQSMIKPHSSM